MTEMRRYRREVLIAGVLFLGTIALFWKVTSNGFINLDTREFVLENQHLQKGLNWESIRWAFTSTFAFNWHPLAWLSHIVDFQLYGMHAGGHHFTSLLIHAFSAVLLFVFFRWATASVWPSAFLAALFAVHPLQVETIAWTYQRKTVLNGFFWIVTLIAYLGYVRRPGARRYSLVLLGYALSLMSKPMSVTLPFTLLLLDYWPLGRLARDVQAQGGRSPRALIRNLQPLILEKLPLFVMAAASSLVTYLVQTDAMKAMANLSFQGRIENAVVAYAKYVLKLFWPRHLAIFYPHPGEHLPTAEVLASLLLLGAVSAAAVWQRRRRPYLIVGWLWFLGTLLPVIGLVQVGVQSMADRYMYVPIIGLGMVLFWEIEHRARSRQYQWPRSVAALFLAALMVGSWFQVRVWESSRTLYMAQFDYQAYARNKDDHVHLLYAQELEKDGRSMEARNQYEQALALNPRNAEAHQGLADLLRSEGLDSEADEHERAAIAAGAGDPGTAVAMALRLMKEGKPEEAIRLYESVLKKDPKNAEVRANLGVALMEIDKVPEAAEQYNAALREDPGNPSANYNLAEILVREGKLEEAMAHYSKAIETDPKFYEARFNLGVLLTRRGKMDDALIQFRRVIELEPKLPQAHFFLGQILVRRGKTDEAVAQFEEALQLDPGYTAARQALESAKSSSSR